MLLKSALSRVGKPSLLLLAATPAMLTAQEKVAPDEAVQELEPVHMYSPVIPDAMLYLPEVQGTKIIGAKKTTNVALEELPEIVDNNYAQVFITTPGITVSEQATPSHANISYRGIGDPHESSSILTMKDGIPLNSDWFGYPTIYYVPPIESIARVEIIRGGGSLLYGPQPGPVINYVSAGPRTDTEFGGSIQAFGGSYGFYSTYLEASGTQDRFGYAADFQATGADGARANADYAVLTGGATVAYQIDEAQRIQFDFDAYSSSNGEAGRLTPTEWDANPQTTTRPIDRVWIERYYPAIYYTRDIEDGLIEVKTWGGFQDRLSRRAKGGSTIAATATNIDDRQFNFYGLDARIRKDYETDFTDGDNTLATGITFYYSDAPRTRETGFATGTTGTPVFDVANSTVYGAAFVENIFRFGDLAVIPAFRLDIPTISAKEEYNFDPTITRALFDETVTSVVPLGALGLTYELDDTKQLYTSFATSYTPKTYGDIGNPTSKRVNTATNEVAYNYQGELGSRGSYSSWFSYDGSLFVDYNTNIVETVNVGANNTIVNNAGDALYYGIEAAVDADLFAFLDAQNGTKLSEEVGALSLFANAQLLQAEFTGGQFNGNKPSYAPTYLIKTGGVFDYRDYLRIGLTSQFVGSQYWNDANTNSGSATPVASNSNPQTIPSYQVWDFSIEFTPIEDFTILAGINNLFDKKYYSRVRGGTGGIEPLDGRTYYAGARYNF
ncbi:TonB-dependent receptor family protein [Cerasicoccus fimbriatus]|uniref:TonB-dependent receptor family protein n=1 Tax=Cerasicoccus fimbriatus TaxID=3014554 RepID=UPI0022B5365E|nr:TonB-dependent receptor [Cerasicoccus sp. TK19100]